MAIQIAKLNVIIKSEDFPSMQVVFRSIQLFRKLPTYVTENSIPSNFQKPEIISQIFQLNSFIIITIIIKGSDVSAIEQYIKSTGKADNRQQTENETNASDSSNVNNYYNELFLSFQSAK